MKIDNSNWKVVEGMVNEAHAKLNNALATALLSLIPAVAWAFGFVSGWWLLSSLICVYLGAGYMKEHFAIRKGLESIKGFMEAYEKVSVSQSDRAEAIVLGGLMRMKNGTDITESTDRCKKELEKLTKENTNE